MIVAALALTCVAAQPAEQPAPRSAAAAPYLRYFAEGSTGFFETTMALLNPSRTETAHVTLKLLVESGGVVSHDVTLAPRERRTVSINDVLGTSAAVSIIVESDVPVAADRWMTWGTSGVGASLDSGTSAPATTWYFAEGATGPFLLYYLFENPADTPANVTIRYLVEGGQSVETTRELPPQSRTTVFVNEEHPALTAASVGAVVTSDVPIFAERAMYVNAGGTLGGGSASATSSEAATEWYFGEGSTGPFFHTFLSLLNPGQNDATATVTYHLSDGSTASKAYDVPAESRRTVYFNGEASADPALTALATGPVWFTVSATQPIVGERAMWWASDWPWYEGHAALGSTTSGVAWAVPEGRHGGPAFDQTYVLIGNTTTTPGQMRLTLIPDLGAGDAMTREVPIAAGERLTLDVGELFDLAPNTTAATHFSVIVESLENPSTPGTPATPLVVDYARYRSVNGLPFSGGGAAPAIAVTPKLLAGPNEAPTFTAGANQTVLEDAGSQTIADWATEISAGPAIESDQTVTFAVTNNTNAALFSVAPAVSPTGTLTFTPAADANGSATITLVLQDDGGTAGGGVDTSVPHDFTITVGAVNDAPGFTAVDPPAVGEDAGAQTLPNWAAFTAGPADENTQTATFTVSNVTNASLFSALPIVASNGTLTFTPADGVNGTATFDVVVQDNGGTANGGADTSGPQTFTITVDAVNDAPVLASTAGPLGFIEQAPATNIDPTITVTDVDSTMLTGAVVQITGNYVNGEDVLSVPNVAAISGTFDPALGQLTLMGTDTVANYQLALRAVQYQNVAASMSPAARTITWIATDGTTPSAAILGTIEMVAVNDVPSFTKGVDQATIEDGGPQVVTTWATSISAGPADESSQTLTFAVTANTNPSLFIVGPTVSSSGALTYVTAPDANGVADVTIELSDDGGTANGGVDTSATQTFRITVADDSQATLEKTLISAPANLDMPESYRLRISVPNTPGVQVMSIDSVVDTPPTGTVFTGATPAATCEPGCIGTVPASLTWTNVCVVTPGSNCDITVNVRFPSSTFSDGQNVTNFFTVDATPVGESVRNIGNASLPHTVATLAPTPGYSFTKQLVTGTPEPLPLNSVFAYQLNLLNDGNVALDNTVIVDTLPIEVSVQSVTTGRYIGLSDFAPGEGVRVSYEKNTALGVFTLWGSSPNTVTNTTLTAPPPGLGAGEYLTRIRWEYGSASPGMMPLVNPLITGQLINPDNAGGPVGGGDSVTNCADLSAVYTPGPTNVNRNSCRPLVVTP